MFLQAVVPDSLRVSFSLNTPSSMPITFFDSAGSPAFPLTEFSTLHDIRQTHGSSSNEYIQVADKLRAYLEQIIGDDNFNLAILTLPPPSLSKRQAPQQSPSPLP